MPPPPALPAALPVPEPVESLPASTTGAEHPAPRPSAQQSGAPARHEVLALFSAVMLPMFLAAVDQTLLATATPRIAAELGDLSQTSWVAVAYLLAATLMAPIYGRMGDRFGRRGALLAALGVFALGSLACGAAQSLIALIGARALQGLGGGGLMVLSQALIGELVPPKLRPRYQGYFAVVFTASSVGGPVIGGYVVNHASWRWLFLANLPLCLLAAWRVAQLPKAARSALRNAPLDPWGVLLFVGTAVGALLWLSLAGHYFRLLSWQTLVLLPAAVACGFALWRQQKRHPSPFLPLDLLRLHGTGWICLDVLCFAGSMFALVFLLPIYLQLGHGASAASSGLQLMPLTVGIVVGSTLNGRITARTGHPTRLPPYGLGAAAIALAAMALLPPSGLSTAIASAVCGIGFGTVMPSAQLATQVIAGRERLGAAAALLSLTRSCGASLGTAAFGGLTFALLRVPGQGTGEGLSLDIGHLSAAQVTHAVHVVFGVLAVFVALGAWAASRVPLLDLADAPG
jgi:EmrB/QacA subfamily drug resistance transporter